jgi:hypothetical protein
LWVIFVLLDPDPDSESRSGSGSTDPIESGSNPDPDTDPDPQPWFELKGETNVEDLDPGSEIRCLFNPWIQDPE